MRVWDMLHTAQCRQLPSTCCAPLPLSRGDQAVDAEIRKQGEVLEKRTPAMKTSLMVHIVDTEATEAKEDCGAGGGGDGAPGSPGAASLLRSPVLDALAELHDARRRATLRDRVAVNARLRVGTLAGSATANVSNAAAGASRVGPTTVPAPSPPTLAAPSPLLTSGAVLPTLPPPWDLRLHHAVRPPATAAHLHRRHWVHPLRRPARALCPLAMRCPSVVQRVAVRMGAALGPCLTRLGPGHPGCRAWSRWPHPLALVVQMGRPRQQQQLQRR